LFKGWIKLNPQDKSLSSGKVLTIQTDYARMTEKIREALTRQA